jgi:hypothetical protein
LEKHVLTNITYSELKDKYSLVAGGLKNHYTSKLFDQLYADIQELESKTIIESGYEEAYKVLLLEKRLLSDIRAVDTNREFYYNVPIEGRLAIEFNESNNFIEADIKCKKVTRQGYVIYNQKYHVITYDGYKGYWDDKGKFIIIDNDNNNDYIEIDTKYWVVDGKLKINDIIYNVDLELYRVPYAIKDDEKIKITNDSIKQKIDEGYNIEYYYEIDENNPPYVTILGDVNLRINKCNMIDWYDVIEFVIHKNSNYNLIVDSISCAKRFPYIKYGSNNVKKYNDENTIINSDNTKHYFNFIDNSYAVNINGENLILYNDRVTINGKDYIVDYEWRNTINGETLHLFIDNMNYSENMNISTSFETTYKISVSYRDKYGKKGVSTFNVNVVVPVRNKITRFISYKYEYTLNPNSIWNTDKTLRKDSITP